MSELFPEFGRPKRRQCEGHEGGLEGLPRRSEMGGRVRCIEGKRVCLLDQAARKSNLVLIQDNTFCLEKHLEQFKPVEKWLNGIERSSIDRAVRDPEPL